MYNSNYINTVPTPTSVDNTWLIVSAVLAIVGGFIGYFLFVADKKTKYTGFVALLHDFLNFKTFFIDIVLKILYLISAIYITLGSFSYIRESVASFFLILIFGNIIARVSYELVLMLITLVNNTTEINKKLSKTKEETKSTTPKVKKKTEE